LHTCSPSSHHSTCHSPTWNSSSFSR
jgi:hypothetical protein